MKHIFEQLCLSTCDIARKTGKYILRERLIFDDKEIESKGLHDLVSYVDKNAEKRIIEELLILIPESGFIAEEGTNTKKGIEYNWIIDPLDGTTNFIHGIPFFAISIALMRFDELVLGVVLELGRDECFYAWKDGGSFLNGNKISVSKRNNIHGALLATGFPYSDFSRVDEYMKILKWGMENSRGIRRLGSAATDLAYVACGRFDVFWEYNLKPWDVAAGAIIVKEAGGIVTDYKGLDNFLFGQEILASNGLIKIPFNEI